MRNCNQCPIFSPFLTLSRRGGAFEAPLAKKKLTSDYVIVSTKLCPQVGNDEYIIVYNFGGGRMSGFRVTEGGLRGPPTTTPVAAQITKKKSPVEIGLKQRLGGPRKQLNYIGKTPFSLTYN